jgi:hypothetical protein
MSATVPFTLLTATTSPLTYEKAVEFNNMQKAPTERELLPKRLKDLREKFESGLGVTCHWATAELGEQIYRMNGQHSANVLTDMNGAFPEGLQVHIDHYKVEDMEGLVLLFRQFDPRESGRSAGDVAGAYQGLESDLTDVAKPIAKLSIEGIAWHNENVEGLPALKGDDKYTLFHNKTYHPFLVWTNGLFGIKTPELRRAQILAAMYGTWRINGPEAEKFWDEVARGGIQNDDDAPSSKLDAWLEGLKAAPQGHKVKPAHFYQASIFAWNAFRRGEKVKTIKHDTSKGFLAIVE